MLAALTLATLAQLPGDPPRPTVDELLPRSTGQFVPAAASPLLEGRPGRWDALLRERGWVMHDESGYRLWYTGYPSQSGLRQVGLATSSDGIRYQRAIDEPVTPAGLWVEDICVVRDPRGGRYEMFAEGPPDRIRRLTSGDGSRWTDVGELDIRLTGGKPVPKPTGTPCVIREANRWLLLYERRDAGIWLAESDDLATWTNVADVPVFRPSESGFDSELIAFNQIVRTSEGYLALYHGSDSRSKPRLWACGAATSLDLVRWTRLSPVPFTRPADNLSSPLTIPIDGRWRLLTTHGRVELLSPP